MTKELDAKNAEKSRRVCAAWKTWRAACAAAERYEATAKKVRTRCERFANDSRTIRERARRQGGVHQGDAAMTKLKPCYKEV